MYEVEGARSAWVWFRKKKIFILIFSPIIHHTPMLQLSPRSKLIQHRDKPPLQRCRGVLAATSLTGQRAKSWLGRLKFMLIAQKRTMNDPLPPNGFKWGKFCRSETRWPVVLFGCMCECTHFVTVVSPHFLILFFLNVSALNMFSLLKISSRSLLTVFPEHFFPYCWFMWVLFYFCVSTVTGS